MMTSALPATTTTTRVTMSTDRITDRYPGKTVPASATARVKLPLELEPRICAPILTAEARSWCSRLISRAGAARVSNYKRRRRSAPLCAGVARRRGAATQWKLFIRVFHVSQEIKTQSLTINHFAFFFSFFFHFSNNEVCVLSVL